jgi:hypothetical protein
VAYFFIGGLFFLSPLHFGVASFFIRGLFLLANKRRPSIVALAY